MTLRPNAAFTLINVSETCYGNIYLKVRNVEQGNVKHEKGIKWNIFDDFFSRKTLCFNFETHVTDVCFRNIDQCAGGII